MPNIVQQLPQMEQQQQQQLQQQQQPQGPCGGCIWLLVDETTRQPVHLRLTTDVLYIERPPSTYGSLNNELLDSTISNKARYVEIKREKPGGLGLSVKGGAEHNLPILISRIFKDQAADRTGQLFVGDAILQVNGINVETFTHDEAVLVLKNGGDQVTLLVRHFQPASNFLANKDVSTSNNNLRDTDNNTITISRRYDENTNSFRRAGKQRTDPLVTIPLLCACISRHKLASTIASSSTVAQLGPNEDSFEVMSLDGAAVAVVLFEEARTSDDWMRNIYRNIVAQNNLSISLTNKQLLSHEHVMHMCWVCEKLSTSNDSNTTSTTESSDCSSKTFRRLFLSLKGGDVSLYEMPPVKTLDWVKCEKSYKIYECIFKIPKMSDVGSAHRGGPRGQSEFHLETVDGVTHILSVETHEELLKLEKAWYKATYHVIKHLTSKTFGCTCGGRLCGLTLDFNNGFCLYESETKACIWNYRFSQLKSSSDDGQNSLKLQFLSSSTNELESWDIESTELRSLLYCVHAFLSAKLASVDPIFLINLE